MPAIENAEINSYCFTMLEKFAKKMKILYVSVIRMMNLLQQLDIYMELQMEWVDMHLEI